MNKQYEIPSLLSLTAAAANGMDARLGDCA